jgi:hypothetical protein
MAGNRKLKVTSVKGGDNTPAAPEATKVVTEITEVDAQGRAITLRKPSCFQKFDLARILGADSMNQAYYLQCMMLLHVVQIDEDECFFGTASEMKALIQQLDDDGISKVTEMFQTHFMPAMLGGLGLEKDIVKK